ncbi:unnamed protein product [Meloidogyne enterolobii]|uniref:Uncharacterized protein n=1 Tax=Meloidogyne enterolobii TaxID=390850 RepID=A0ACB0XZM2_MELEN
MREYERKYRENNREKKREADRKYREKMKNRKENLQDPRNVDSDNNERGTSNPQNDDARNKGKMPNVYEDSIQSEERNLINQEEEETETFLDEQNQQEVEEPKIPENCMTQIDLNEKYYPFDLNEKPEDNDEDVC